MGILLKEYEAMSRILFHTRREWEKMGEEQYGWLTVAFKLAMSVGEVDWHTDNARVDAFVDFFELVDVMTDEYGSEYFPDEFNDWLGRRTDG